MTCITFTVPIRTKSTANLREHHMARYRRTDGQKRAVRRRCPAWTAGPLLEVRLTRVAPRQLDDDNLAGALKSVRDAVATWLRVDDGSPLVRWAYAQERGEAAVRVEVRTPDVVAGLVAQLEDGTPMPSVRAVSPPAPPGRRSAGGSFSDIATPNHIPGRRE